MFGADNSLEILALQVGKECFLSTAQTKQVFILLSMEIFIFNP
jgi:hypothetical protein